MGVLEENKPLTSRKRLVSGHKLDNKSIWQSPLFLSLQLISHR